MLKRENRDLKSSIGSRRASDNWSSKPGHVRLTGPDANAMAGEAVMGEEITPPQVGAIALSGD